MKTKIIALMAAGLLTMSMVGPAFANPGQGGPGTANAHDKVDVCHVEGDGSAHIINITTVAFENNHETHGDKLINETLVGSEYITEAACLALPA